MRSQKNASSENGVKRNIGFTKKRSKCYRSKHKAWKQGPPQNNGPPEGNTNTSNSSSHQGNSQQAPPRGTNSHQGNSQPPERGHFREAIKEAAARRLEMLRRSLEPHFAFICCEFTIDTTTIQRAHRKKALILHPGKGGDAEHFKKLGSSLNKIMTAIGTYLQIFSEMA